MGCGGCCDGFGGDGGGPPAAPQSLAQTLVIGNVTGPTDIVQTDATALRGLDAAAVGPGGDLRLRGGNSLGSFEVAGSVRIAGGSGGGSVVAGDVILEGGEGPPGASGDGGDFLSRAGNGGDTGGTAGNWSGSGGKGPGNVAGGPGGNASLRSGDGGAQAGAGGELTLRSGDGFGPGDPGGDLFIEGGVSADGAGADITIAAGEGFDAGGSVGLSAGSAVNPVGAPGEVGLRAGSAENAGGAVTIGAGEALLNGVGGDVMINAGNGDDGGGGVFLEGGFALGSGGPVGLTAGSSAGAGPGGDVSLIAGLGAPHGNIRLESHGITYRWPQADGLPGAVLSTDGAGNLEFGDLGRAYTFSVQGTQAAAFTALGVTTTNGGSPVVTAKTVTAGNVYARAPNVTEMNTVATPAVVSRATLSTGAGVIMGYRGFDIRCTFGISEGPSVNPLHEATVGLGVGTWLGAPSAFVNQLSVGWGGADANIQVFHNDAAGAATQVNTGIPKPATDRENLYTARFVQAPGSLDVRISITRKSDNLTFSTLVTTNRPALDVVLNARAQSTTGAGVNFVSGLGVGSIFGRIG